MVRHRARCEKAPRLDLQSSCTLPSPRFLILSRHRSYLLVCLCSYSPSAPTLHPHQHFDPRTLHSSGYPHTSICTSVSFPCPVFISSASHSCLYSSRLAHFPLSTFRSLSYFVALVLSFLVWVFFPIITQRSTACIIKTSLCHRDNAMHALLLLHFSSSLLD